MKAKFWYDEHNWRTVETDPPDYLVADFIRSCRVETCHQLIQIYEDITSGKVTTSTTGVNYTSVYFEADIIYVEQNYGEEYPIYKSGKHSAKDFVEIIKDYMRFLQKPLEDFLLKNYPEIAWDFEKSDYGQYGNPAAVLPLYRAFTYTPERQKLFYLAGLTLTGLGAVIIPFLIEQTKKLSLEEPEQVKELRDIFSLLANVDDGTGRNYRLYYNDQLIEFFEANRNHPDKGVAGEISNWFYSKEIVEEEGLYD
jgi:hypothetical protein